MQRRFPAWYRAALMACAPVSLVGCSANVADENAQPTAQSPQQPLSPVAADVSATAAPTADPSVRAVSYAYDPGELKVTDVAPAGGIQAGVDAGSR
jgi:hypothetical protein